MPWSPSAVARFEDLSLLHYTILYRNPRAELYNDSTLITSMPFYAYFIDYLADGGFIDIEFFDNSTDAYTFNRIVVKRDPYTAPDGSSKDVILTINIPEGRTKTADESLTFRIRLTITTTSG